MILYGSSVADTILTTACQMATASGGVETSKASTYTGTGNFGEVWSKGNASLNAVAAIPATPTGHGWIYYPGAGTFALGNWSPIITMAVTVNNAGNQTFRLFKLPGGVLASAVSIGTITFIATTAAKTTYTLTPTSMPATTFAAGDGLYFDLWYQDNTGAGGGDTATVYESTSVTSGVANDFQVTTSTFTPAATGPVIARPKNVLRAFTGALLNRAFQMRALSATLIKRYQPPTPTTAYSAAILANHPIAYYRMDEVAGNVAYDLSGNGYHASLSGVTQQSESGAVGDIDASTLFTAAGGITLPPSLHTELMPTIGIEFWIQVEGVWEYVGVDWDGTTTTIYRNGVPYTPGSGASVGIEQGFAWLGAALTGNLDEIALYPRLTATMAIADYTIGATIFPTFFPRAFSAVRIVQNSIYTPRAFSATLVRNNAITLSPATLAGTGILAGSLSFLLDLGSVTLAGTSTLVGTAQLATPLADTFVGAGTFTSASATLATALSGTFAGSGVQSATLSAQASLACTLAGLSTNTASLSAGVAVTSTLAGVGTCTSTWTLATAFTNTEAGVGTLTGSLVASLQLSGVTLTGVGILTATLAEGTAMSSTVNGVGTLAGSMSATAMLASTTIAGVGTLSGTAGLATNLTVTVPGRGVLAGVLGSTAPVALSGTLSGIGMLTGTPVFTIFKSGTIAGVGTLSGAVQLATNVTASIPGIGMLTGTLAANVQLASVTFPGAGTLTGTLSESTSLTATFPGMGMLAATATFVLTLPVVTMAGAGTVAGVESLGTALTATLAGGGVLTGAAPTFKTALTSTLMGQGQLAGILSGSGALVGTCAGVGTLQAGFTLATALSASTNGVGMLLGTVHEGTALTVTLVGSSQVSAQVQLQTALVGSASGMGTLAFTLFLGTSFTVSLSGAGTLTSTGLSERTSLALVFAAFSSLTGHLIVPPIAYLSATCVTRDMQVTARTRDMTATCVTRDMQATSKTRS